MNKETSQTIVLLDANGNIKFPNYFSRQHHTHILCLEGQLRFSFNGRPYICKDGGFAFFFANSKLSDFRFSKNFKAKVLFVEMNFLNENIPDQKLSMDAFLYSSQNPLLYLDGESDKEKVLLNFQFLNERYLEKTHRFYTEVLRRQMQLFILDMWHIFANNYERRKRSVHSGTLYERFMELMLEHSTTDREVKFYAGKLNITAKYLNYISKQNTGITASDWIQRHAIERIKWLLENEKLNVAQIADEMNFSSRSFFTRYVKKQLGMTPSEYRNRLK